MTERVGVGGDNDTPPPPPPPPPPPREVVSDQEIAEALHSILLETNPNLLNLNVIVGQLQSTFNVDLSPKIDFIRFHINHFFSHLQARTQTQTQTQARTQTLFAHPQHQLQLQLQEEVRGNVVKDNIALQQNRGYYFPQNFSLQGRELPSPELPPRSNQVTQGAPAQQPVLVAHKITKVGGQPEKKRRGGPGGLTKLCGVSPELQTIVGQPTMPRTEIVKQLWAYIKKHNLQDPSNKRKINCNDELRLLFETDCTDMFKMNKLLSKHILTLDSAQTSKKPKVDTESGSESADSVPIVVISEALANFFGTEEREMPQPEVLKQMWEYVKVNKLEDPANAMAIHCDEKLKELFGCESISALGIPEMLSRRHLTNKS